MGSVSVMRQREKKFISRFELLFKPKFSESYYYTNIGNLHAHFVPCGLCLLLSFWSLVRSVLCLRGCDNFLFCFFSQRSWCFVRNRWRYVMSKGGPGSCKMHSLHRMLTNRSEAKSEDLIPIKDPLPQGYKEYRSH